MVVGGLLQRMQTSPRLCVEVIQVGKIARVYTRSGWMIESCHPNLMGHHVDCQKLGIAIQPPYPISLYSSLSYLLHLDLATIYRELYAYQ